MTIPTTTTTTTTKEPAMTPLRQLSLRTLVETRVTKEEQWREYANHSDMGAVDYALPQTWLERFASHCGQHDLLMMDGMDPYQIITGTMVWAYSVGSTFGRPVTCCIETQEALDHFHLNG